MEHIVRKAFFDYEKEAKYLNEMSEKGLALVNYTWCKYVFEDAPKGEYIYRIELLENPVNHPNSQNYIRFMEETGVEFITSYNRWAYFRKKADEGAFDIYSDIDSKMKHYKRVRIFFLILMAFNFIIGVQNFFYGNFETTMGILPINIYAAIVSFAVGTFFLIFLVIPLSRKIMLLEKEKQIRE